MRIFTWRGPVVVMWIALMGSCGTGTASEPSTDDTSGAPGMSVVSVAPVAEPPSTELPPEPPRIAGADDTVASPVELVVPVPTVTPRGAVELRFPALARVGNISMWFTLFWEVDNPRGDPAYIGDDALAEVVAEGFTGLRLPIDPALVADETGTLLPEMVARVVDAVDRIQAHGLAAIIDLHIWEPDQWQSPEQVQRVEWIWKQLAVVFADYDPTLTFLELYNEPGWWDDPQAWAPYEQSMYEVVRGLAPALPIVLSGPMSSWIDGLVDAWVVDDPNVVYTIHVYDPFVFTHQGADWTVEPGLVEAVAIPFPALPGPCSTAIEAQPTPAAAMLVTDYCAQGYDEEWVRHRLETAARWAAERGVVLFLGEFGVSPTANVADAARWFAAVTDAAEEFGIGWSVWSLDAAMGPRRASGWLTDLRDPIDPLLRAALGLPAP